MRQTLPYDLQPLGWQTTAKAWRIKRRIFRQLSLRLRNNTTKNNMIIAEPIPSPSAPDSDSDTIIADDPKTPSPSPEPEPSPSPNP